jgi:hypothetical protein
MTFEAISKLLSASASVGHRHCATIYLRMALSETDDGRHTGGYAMRATTLAALLLTTATLLPAYAAEDKAKEWCTETHMKKMDDMAAKMTDAAKQKDAQSELTMSRGAMDNEDMAGCVMHMENAHTAMGL